MHQKYKYARFVSKTLDLSPVCFYFIFILYYYSNNYIGMDYKYSHHHHFSRQ